MQADRKYEHAKPVCLGGSETAMNPPKRHHTLGPFILDELLAAGAAITDQLLQDYESMGRRFHTATPDPDILLPWRSIESALRAKSMPAAIEEELHRLRQHVETIRQEWRTIFSSRPRNTSYGPASKQEAKLAKKQTNEKIIALARRYAQTPEGCGTLDLLSNIGKLKASYLYSIHSDLAFRIAFQALCRIKADAAGSTAFTREFAEAMTIPGAEVRVRSQFNAVESFVIAG